MMNVLFRRKTSTASVAGKGTVVAVEAFNSTTSRCGFLWLKRERSKYSQNSGYIVKSCVISYIEYESYYPSPH